MYDAIVVGSGFAGAVIARELAEQAHQKVLILEKRNHIGGNCYDCYDHQNVLIHQYGPHIFHTNHKEVFDYLSRFTKWYDYEHQVAGYVHGKLLPIPFNLNTLETVYEEPHRSIIKDKLIAQFGMGARVPILDLMNSDDNDVRQVAYYVYENIFLKYTMKQWGQKPEEIEPSVTSRVPILISYDNRYFQDTYQGMPADGYTACFERMLSHDNMTVRLNTDAIPLLKIRNRQVYFDNKPFHGPVIYTGPLDEFFLYEYGQLPYRSLRFAFEEHPVESFQTHSVINYTVSEEYTRITEFKKLTGQHIPNKTTIVKEYPIPYSDVETEIPYYAIMNQDNLLLHERYMTKLDQIKNFYVLGRLAEYKYYNIDTIVEKALALFHTITNPKRGLSH